ncbi:MAG TPA: stalk domain-containing protein, partial [Vicinamibacterales bacterium]|nr:stalk domain-containing protein [Vicinamibacterales bacterium]
MPARRAFHPLHAFTVLALALAAATVFSQAPNQPAPITVLSRDGRKPLPTVEVQGHTMVGLDDLTPLFQLTVREDTAVRAVTVTYKNQTIVLTPDQTLASMSGRLVSLPAPVTRQGRRVLVPVEFLSRALALIYDARLDYRPASRLLVVGDLRVPRVSARYEGTLNSVRVTLEITPKTAAVVSQDQNRIFIRIDADALDAALPSSTPPNDLLIGARVMEPNAIQLDVGSRFASYRSSTPTSAGASAEVTVEILSAAPESSGAAPAPGPAAAAATSLPVFGEPRSSIRTIVIDPGHGGDDNGVRGPGGGLEKDVVLAV